MIPDAMTNGPSFVEQRLIARTRLILALMVMVIGARIVYYTGSLPDLGGNGVSDFDLFHVIAKAIGGGELAKAYSIESLMDLMEKYGSFREPIPWAYPPPFNLVLAPLGLMPIALAYALFLGTTFAAWLWVLKRQAGAMMILPILITFPGVFVELSAGQNGFLTAFLLGLAATWMLENRNKAGVPLGLMVIKPHLAVTFGLASLLKRRWSVIAIAAVSALFVCALATLAFGIEIWPAYRAAVKENIGFLDKGYFPTARMVTAYAVVQSLNLGSSLAFAAQTLVTVLVLAANVHLGLKKDLRTALGFALVTAPMISPYAYDYDTPIATVGLALVIASIIRHSGKGERSLIYILGILMSGSGLFSRFPQMFAGYLTGSAWANPITFAAIFYVALAMILYRVLLRAEEAAKA